MKKTIVAGLALFTYISTGLSAEAKEDGGKGMKDSKRGMKQPMPPQSNLDFQEHVQRLSLFLSVVYSGNADADFAKLLMVQKRALADLAKLELKHGSDPELRKIAQAIVDDEKRAEEEISNWQLRQKKK